MRLSIFGPVVVHSRVPHVGNTVNEYSGETDRRQRCNRIKDRVLLTNYKKLAYLLPFEDLDTRFLTSVAPPSVQPRSHNRWTQRYPQK